MKSRRLRGCIGWAGFVSIVVSATAADPAREISLRLDKSRYEAGEPIVATLEIINRSDTQYAVQTSTEETGAWDGYSFVVTDERGAALPAPRTLRTGTSWIGSWRPIQRHERYERKLFLNYWFTPPLPGPYRAQGRYTLRAADPEAAGKPPTLNTSTVEFKIVPVTAMKLEVRLARLSEFAAKADPVALDFPGFTGSSEAIQPLLEALCFDEVRVQLRAANALNYLTEQNRVLDAAITKLRELGPNPMIAEWLRFRNAPAEKLLPSASRRPTPTTQMSGSAPLPAFASGTTQRWPAKNSANPCAPQS